MARAMKDSGIAWIGEIPEEWEVCPLKNVIQWKSEKNHEDSTVLSLYRDYGIIPKDSRDDNHNVTSLDTSGYKYVQPGDLVINKMKAWQGSIAVSDYEGIVSPAYHVCAITNPRINKRYLHHLLRNPAYLPEYMRLSTGMRVGQWDLGFDDFKNIPIVVPSLAEQERITCFIDQECARIDSVIEQTRASIEEYKKLKQAVITQAVTKGIRLNRPMKDSGSRWIGSIPCEWAAIISRFVFEQVGDVDHLMPDSVDEGIPYVMTGDLKPTLSQVEFDRCKKIGEDDYISLGRKIKPAVGDVIFARYATIGTVCYVDTDIDCVISYSCVTIKPCKDKLSGKYLFYYLQSSSFFEDVNQYINSNTQGNVGIEALFSVKIPVPSLEEQLEIAAYLDRKIEGITNLIEKKNKLLAELENYKKSLIFEYVTGKKEGIHRLNWNNA